MYRLPLIALCALLSASCAGRSQPSAHGATRPDATASFAAEIDALRTELRIPGLAAAVVRDGAVAWSGGFGAGITPHTPFHTASLTKPVAAIVLMQLVDAGAVRLDDPLSKWGIRLGSGAQLWNLVSHSTSGSYHYDSARYALLGGVIGRASGAGFERRLYERVVKPLGLRDTAPNGEADWGTFLGSVGIGAAERHAAGVYARLAPPFRITERFAVGRGWYSFEQSPSAGLISSAADLASLDIALDAGKLIRRETRELMWRPVVPTSELDGSLWYASGWFVQYAYGTRLVWHYGIWPPSVSALWLKVPDQRLSLVLLANTDGLSAPFPLGEGDVLTSAFALAFARSFVYPRMTGSGLPAVSWKAPEAELVASLRRVGDPLARELLERELWARRQVFASAGRWELAARLARVQRAVYPDSWRAGDRRFTATSGGSTPEEPPRLGVRGFVWGGRLAAVWLFAVAASAVLLFRAPGRRDEPFAARIRRLPEVVVFGPLGLLLPRRARLGAAAFEALESASRHALCLLAAVVVVVERRPALPLGLAILPAAFAAALIGLFVRRPLRASGEGGGYRAAVRAALLPELAGTGVAASAASVAFVALERLWFPGGVPTGHPLFWAAVPVAAAVGAALLLPVVSWAMAGGAERDDAPGSRLARFDTAWPALAVAAAAVAASAVGVTRLAG